jgi:phage shock protein PspC (stress-responsive transcriptional regulator)
MELRRSTMLRKLPWKRSRTEGLVFGVCSGLARRLGCRPIRVRTLLILASLFLCGVPVIAYLATALAVPADDSA